MFFCNIMYINSYFKIKLNGDIMFGANKNKNEFNYYEQMELQRLYYELEEINRRIRNLNNRLRRVEGFLGLSVDDENIGRNA